MKIVHWNIRGLGLPEKHCFLKEFISREYFDIVYIQETEKEDFTQRFLTYISPKFTE
jgi:exonuclease III